MTKSNTNKPQYISSDDNFIVKYNEKEMLLSIVSDDDAESPREWDNIGTMICFHHRYCLGDKHNYLNSDSFLRDLARNSISDKEVEEINMYVKSGQAKDLRLQYDQSTNEWGLEEYNYYLNKWSEIKRFTDPLNLKDSMLVDDIIESMNNEDLIKIITKNNYILPLFLYDHSGLRIKTSSFQCQWDSCQVGWIYVNKQKIFDNCMWIEPELRSTKDFTILNNPNNWQAPTEDNWQKISDHCLKNEVEIYDHYLTNSVYGYQLFELDENNEVVDMVDSCYGFYGNETDFNGILDEFTILRRVNVHKEKIISERIRVI